MELKSILAPFSDRSFLCIVLHPDILCNTNVGTQKEPSRKGRLLCFKISRQPLVPSLEESVLKPRRLVGVRRVFHSSCSSSHWSQAA